MFKTNKWEFAFAVLLIAFASFLFFNQKNKSYGANAGWQLQYSGSGTAVSVTVGMANTGVPLVASSTQVLASNTSAINRRIVNTGTRPAACLQGLTSTSTVLLGIVIDPLASSTVSAYGYEGNMNNA